MKLYKNALILLAVVVLLGTAYFIINGKNSDGNSQDLSQANTIQVLNVNIDTMSEIDIEHNNERLVFVKNENKWTLTEPANINYDQGLADGLPLSILYFTASKVITEQTNDLSQYGLDNPSVVSVKTTDGKTVILEIGNLTSSKDSYYLKNKDSDKVYIIDKAKVDSILLTLKSIKDKNVLNLERDLQSTILADDMISLSLEKDGELVFSARKNEADGKWSLIAPVQENVDNSEIAPILAAISRVMALEFIDVNPEELNQYGLVNPQYSLEFENATGRKKLLIGDEKETGTEFYAMVEGQNDVFSLNEAGFNFLDKPLEEFIQ
ncbi:MAG: DUF4340 domain-containing protein [Acetobacterium sp.]